MSDLKSQLAQPGERELFIEKVAVGALIADPDNARKHSKKQIERLSAAIAEFGFTNPIQIDEENRIIAGHGRLDAARAAGLHEVPCVRIAGLSKQQRKALAIADNKYGDMSVFDPDRLLATLAELDQLEYTIELTGFDTAELDVLQEAATALDGRLADPADDLAPAGPPVSLSGDLWLLGPHRLLCGNSLEEASFTTLLGEERADLVVCDMPYNVPVQGHVTGLGRAKHREFAFASGEMSRPAFTQFLTSAMGLMARFSVDGSIHYQFMDWRHMNEMLEAGEAVYTELKNLCIWDKGQGGMGSLYRSQHELVFVFKNGKAAHCNNVELGRHGRNRSNVWTYAGLNSFGRERDALLGVHPTVKPVGLVADAIRDCSKRGALVLDPFCGSGTTILAAERTRRRAAAIEIDPMYVDAAVRRWQKLVGKPAALAGDGRTFKDIGAVRGAELASSDREAAHG